MCAAALDRRIEFNHSSGVPHLVQRRGTQDVHIQAVTPRITNGIVQDRLTTRWTFHPYQVEAYASHNQ
jgi:hypothetical protein